MNGTTDICGHEIRTLQSIARDWGVPTYFIHGDILTHPQLVENHQQIEPDHTDPGQIVDFQSEQFQVPFVPELPVTEATNIPSPVDYFDWFQLPLNDPLLMEGDFFSSFYAQNEWQYSGLENHAMESTAFST